MPNHRAARVLLRALRVSSAGFANKFLFTYSLAAGTALLLHLVKTLRTKGKTVSLTGLVGEASLRFRVPASRAALFVGGFTMLYKLGVELSALGGGSGEEDELVPAEDASTASEGEARPVDESGRASPLVVAASAAVAAGAASMALAPPTRASMSLYTLTRAMHVLWRAARSRGLLGSAKPSAWVEAGFRGVSEALCVGVVMYAYVMRPGALDPSLRRFMVNTAPVDPVALRAAAAAARGDPVDVAEVNRYVTAVCPDWRERWGGGELGGTVRAGTTPEWWPADMGPPGEARMTWGEWWSAVAAGAWPALNPLRQQRPGKLRDLRRWLKAAGRSAAPPGAAPYLSAPPAATPLPPAAGTALSPWGQPDGPAARPLVSVAPSIVLRPQQPVSVLHWLETFSSAFRSTLPLYSVLGVVPVAAFRTSALVRRPLSVAWDVATTATRSAVFISSFVTVYMASIDLFHRYASPATAAGSPRSSRLVFLGAGMVTSLTMALERRSRRAELLMYCFARSLEVMAAVLAARGWRAVPGWDSVLLGLSTGVLVYAHRFEPGLLGALPRAVLDSILGKALL